MALALKDVRRIASEVAPQQNPALEVISATSAGVSRNASEAELRQAVADRLRAHAAEHQPVAPR